MSIKSTIFTTKNKELDIFGQTLSDVKKKLIDFNDVWMQGGRYGSNKAQIIPEENLIKVLSIDEAKQQLQSLNQFVNSGKMTYEEYFNTIGKGNTVLRTYVTTTDQQSQSAQGLVKASQEARAAQIAQNEAIQASTLSAKAATVATKALSIAGNMVVMWAISAVISKVVKSINDYIHAADKIKESAETAQSNIENLNSTFEDTKAKAASALETYNELASGMDLRSNKNVSLSDDEYKDFLSASNELAELFPELVSYYDSNGNAILNLGNDAGQAAEKINELIEVQKQQLALDIRDDLPDVFAGINQDLDGINEDKSDISNMFDGSNSSFIGTYEQLQKIQAIIKDITGKELAIETSVDGNSFIDTYGTLDLEEQLKVYQEVLSDANYDDLAGTAIQAETALKAIEIQFGSMKDAIMSLNTDSVQQAYQSQLPDIFTALSTDDTFSALGEIPQDFVSALITNLDYASVADEVAGEYGNDIVAYLQDKIITPIADSLQDDENAAALQEAFSNLLSINTEDALSSNLDKIRTYITTIANILGDGYTSDDIASWLGYDLEAKTAKISNAQKKVTGTDSLQAGNQYDAKKAQMNHYIAGLSEEQLDILMNIPDETKFDTKEEIENYLNEIQGNSTITITTHIDIAESLNQMQSGLSELFSTLKDYNENGLSGMDISAFISLQNSFGEIDGSTDAFEEFLSVMEDLNSTSEDVQNAFDQLASEYLYHSELAEDITEENKDYIASELEKAGVLNAAAVAEQMLANKYGAEKVAIDEVVKANLSLNGTKLTSANAGEILNNATANEIAQLINEANAVGQNTAALQQMLLQKIQANQITLATNGDISNLISLCNMLGTASNYLVKYQSLKNKLTDPNYHWTTADTEQLKGLEKLANGEVQAALNIGTTANTGGGAAASATASSSGTSTTKSTFSELFDWIERRIDKFQTKFDRWLNQAETALTAGKIEKYYNKAATQIEGLMNTYSKAYDKYIKKADNVGLSAKYQKKVQNGTISLETIKDEELADKISTYQEYWDQAQEYLDAYIEQAEKLADIPLDKAAAKIEKFNDAIELLEAQIDNTSVDDYKAANKLINKETKKQEKILTASQTAVTDTESRLKKAGTTLSKNKYLNSDDGITSAEKKKIKQAIKNGQEVNLAYFTEGSDGYKAAVAYNEALKANTEAIQEAALAQEEYNAWLEDAAEQKFENIQTYYEAQVNRLDNQISLIEKDIDLIEAKGMTVTSNYYKQQISLEQEKLSQYEKEKKELEKQLAATEALGLTGTQTWYDMKEALSALDEAIKESNVDITELNQSITELADNAFTKLLSARNLQNEIADWAVSLMELVDSFDENTGAFTNEGMERLSSYVSGYQNSQANSDDYKKLLNNLQTQYNQGNLSFTDAFGNARIYNSMEEFKAAIDELYEDWRDQISTTYEYETKIVEMMQNKLQAELSLVQDLVDAKKDALSAEKDLHDYQKSIQSATENITSLEKQIISIKGDSSEEGLARLQKLQKELADAQEDLIETEYDRYISDQQDMLDTLYDEYSDFITSEINDIETLLQQGIDIVSNGLGTEGVIAQYLEKYSYKRSTVVDKSSVTQQSVASNTETSTTASSGDISTHGVVNAATGTVNFGSIATPTATIAGSSKNTVGTAVISPLQSPEIQQLLQTVPAMNDFTKALSGLQLPDISKIPAASYNTSPANINAEYNFTLENCSNADDMIRYIQTDQNIQRALKSVTVDQLSGSSRLAVNKY